ncbi:hypothetical protein SELMODRAFT_141036 [Selaginella moellendorffii]|uniref:Dolichyl-diphosphooligosaccharide-protein glycosyltransferase subunit OST5 n=1 Tax=Selaginella moellendorffii TaxID=88036 RepID=D8QU56_SELML|nr:transmembrane protein 258 [Selaginella moellendorffii]XP_024519919.1 transmembrane protein 258-like [Selaginella moellendorffii]EFJ35807.1 hypothetical protein SELMODRAFT_141036 [Selaginella moellendorffii]|eukprot:XP_002962344.1 transmembrane protein 258 [Selaginella moellendorffii]
MAVAISSPVPEGLYPLLTILFLTVGLVLTASFFIYEITTSSLSRSFPREILTGGASSIFLGLGALFLLLSTGVYV